MVTAPWGQVPKYRAPLVAYGSGLDGELKGNP
jgi:hypothetical protein